MYYYHFQGCEICQLFQLGVNFITLNYYFLQGEKTQMKAKKIEFSLFFSSRCFGWVKNAQEFQKCNHIYRKFGKQTHNSTQTFYLLPLQTHCPTIQLLWHYCLDYHELSPQQEVIMSVQRKKKNNNIQLAHKCNQDCAHTAKIHRNVCKAYVLAEA